MNPLSLDSEMTEIPSGENVDLAEMFLTAVTHADLSRLTPLTTPTFSLSEMELTLLTSPALHPEFPAEKSLLKQPTKRVAGDTVRSQPYSLQPELSQLSNLIFNPNLMQTPFLTPVHTPQLIPSSAPLTPAQLMQQAADITLINCFTSPAHSPQNLELLPRRESHKEAEQRRRDTMKTLIEELRTLVPNLDKNSSRISVLEKKSPDFHSSFSQEEIQEIRDIVKYKSNISSPRIIHKERKVKQGKLLLVSLLENFCDMYDESPERNRRLFFAICKQLANMGIIDTEDFLDELSSVRTASKKAFKELVIQAVEALKDGTKTITLGEYPRDTSDYQDTQETASSLSDYITPHSAGASSISRMSDLLHSQHPSRFRDEFIILEKLGKGAFGVVWKAKNKLDGVFYAIKSISGTKWIKSDFMKILREVKSLARMSHPNVVRYYGSWLEDQSNHIHNHQQPESEDNSPESTSYPETRKINEFHEKITSPDLTNIALYIQMELCEYTLSKWIKERNEKYCAGIYHERDIGKDSLNIFFQIIQGLSYIHSKKCIHRDIKPSNIYWKSKEDRNEIKSISDYSRGYWKIGDFGLVKEDIEGDNGDVEFSSLQVSISNHGVSRKTTGVGTFLYASPEQLDRKGLGYSYKSDVYSLGIVLFELLCPFSTAMERAKALQNVRDGVLPDSFVKQWPKEAMIILWLTSEDPTQRPTLDQIQSFDLFQQSLNDLERGIMIQCENPKCTCCVKWKNRIVELENRISELEKEVRIQRSRDL